MHPVQGTGRVGSLFVEAMTREAASEKDAQVWQSILRNLFSTLRDISFTKPIAALESKLFALDVFLRSPMLQRLLVSRIFVPHWSHFCTPWALLSFRLAGPHHPILCLVNRE